MNTALLKRPGAFTPIGMSLAALMIVMIYAVMFGTARQADEAMLRTCGRSSWPRRSLSSRTSHSGGSPSSQNRASPSWHCRLQRHPLRLSPSGGSTGDGFLITLFGISAVVSVLMAAHFELRVISWQLA